MDRQAGYPRRQAAWCDPVRSRGQRFARLEADEQVQEKRRADFAEGRGMVKVDW